MMLDDPRAIAFKMNGKEIEALIFMVYIQKIIVPNFNWEAHTFITSSK